ncbi:hypothetical protein RYX36_027731 [Vicia faba]
MQESMQQLNLQFREPLVDHPLRSRDDLIAYANWAEGGPSTQEEAAEDDEIEADDVSSGDSVFDVDEEYLMMG